MNHPDPKEIELTMRRLKICVIIPTYNNAGTLAHVLDGIQTYTSDIIVVNDGSTDATSEILSARKEEITIVEYETNRGKGYALKQGFKRAVGMGFDYAITIDSDGQHYPENIVDFVRAIAENPGALIVGSRDLSKVDINRKSTFANKFSNFWFALQTGRKLSDTQTGFRAYPLHHLHGLRFLTSRYEAELELMVFSAWNGVKLIEIPIRVYYPPQSRRVSHFRPALDFTRISILNTILCFGAAIYGWPAKLWHMIAKKRIFNFEFRPFTRCNGRKKEAATTLGRLGASLYGILFFGFWSMFVFTPMTILFFSFGKKTETKQLRFHSFLQWASKSLVKRFPGANTCYRNFSERIFDTPAVVVCNHQSILDLPVIMALSPRLVFLTNDWVWNNIFYGRIIHQADFLPVSIGLDTILPKLKKLRDEGYSVVVFPEGTRSANGKIQRFHQGAFYLAEKLDVDIIPMTIHGLSDYLPKMDMMFRRGRNTLSVLPRANRREFGELPLHSQASRFRSLIRGEFHRIADEVENADYFRPLVSYKYAYRGWRITARAKRELKLSANYENLINAKAKLSKIRFINAGIGVIPLLYALANSTTEVFAYESSREDFRVARQTPQLPSNLHFIHAVWDSEFGENSSFDLTIQLPRLS